MAISFSVRVMKWQLCDKREDPPHKDHTLYALPSGCSVPNHCKVGAKGGDAMTAVITSFLCHGEMWSWYSGILLWGWRLSYPQTGTVSSRHLRSTEGICGNEGLLSPQEQISQKELYPRAEFNTRNLVLVCKHSLRCLILSAHWGQGSNILTLGMENGKCWLMLWLCSWSWDRVLQSEAWCPMTEQLIFM